MGGRIDDIAVSEQNPYVIYVAFATNGVWKSTNNGTTFQPIFELRHSLYRRRRDRAFRSEHRLGGHRRT